MVLGGKLSTSTISRISAEWNESSEKNISGSRLFGWCKSCLLFIHLLTTLGVDIDGSSGVSDAIYFQLEIDEKIFNYSSPELWIHLFLFESTPRRHETQLNKMFSWHFRINRNAVQLQCLRHCGKCATLFATCASIDNRLFRCRMSEKYFWRIIVVQKVAIYNWWCKNIDISVSLCRCS